MSFGQHFAKSVFPTIHRNQVISKPQNARPSEWGLKHKLRVNYKYVQVNAMDSVHKIPRVSSGRKRVDMVLIWKENFPGSSPRPNPLIYAPVCMDRHFGQMSMNEWREWVKYAYSRANDKIKAPQLINTHGISYSESLSPTITGKFQRQVGNGYSKDPRAERYNVYGFSAKINNYKVSSVVDTYTVKFNMQKDGSMFLQLDKKYNASAEQNNRDALDRLNRAQMPAVPPIDVLGIPNKPIDASDLSKLLSQALTPKRPKP
jgi:hypothetical protein